MTNAGNICTEEVSACAWGSETGAGAEAEARVTGVGTDAVNNCFEKTPSKNTNASQKQSIINQTIIEVFVLDEEYIANA